MQFLFLRMLYERQMHGYQLNEELTKRDFLPLGRMESGSVYTILRRMESRGLVTSDWERAEGGLDRRIYKVTDDGREVLKTWIESVLRRKALMDDLAAFYRRYFHEDEGDPGESQSDELRGGEKGDG
jgi:PadR family transcriptional regulator PadR